MSVYLSLIAHVVRTEAVNKGYSGRPLSIVNSLGKMALLHLYNAVQRHYGSSCNKIKCKKKQTKTHYIHSNTQSILPIFYPNYTIIFSYTYLAVHILLFQIKCMEISSISKDITLLIVGHIIKL